MPEVTVSIGGRSFDVACQEGEQRYVEAAARMLDEEASALVAQMGRVPEPRMLLMAGLMLADKTGSMGERITELEAELDAMRARLAQESSREATRVEVPVIPGAVADGLAELAARAEALADHMEAVEAGS